MQRVNIRRVERAPVLVRRTKPGMVGRLIGWLRTVAWRERKRHELAARHGRDFGDLAVPRSLVADDTRRWPRQNSSRHWREVAPACNAVREAVLDRMGSRDRHDAPGPMAAAAAGSVLRA